MKKQDMFSSSKYNLIRNMQHIASILIFLALALILNIDCFAQSDNKVVYSFCFGAHKNLFLNRDYISADISIHPHHNVTNLGYKLDDELAINGGLMLTKSISKNLSISSGLLLWTHNYNKRTQRDTLIKYEDGHWPYAPLYKKEISRNIEIPFLVNYELHRFTATFGCNLHLITFKSTYMELGNNDVNNEFEIHYFENRNNAYYNNNLWDFIAWRLALKYKVLSAQPVYIETGINSIGEVWFGFEFQIF